MSKQLLETLNGNKKGEFKKFIDSLKHEPRIAWYPSAGTDFRALLYLHPNYAKGNPAINTEPESPDIFLFTDYSPNKSLTFLPNKSSTFLDTIEVCNFGKTSVTIENNEELPTLNIPFHHNSVIVGLPNGKTKNKVVYLKIKINSEEHGEYSYTVLYAFAENEAFCAEILIPNNTMLSHIIHIRYGGGCGGGGNATGVWILNVLKKLNCKVFITDNCLGTGMINRWQDGDNAAVDLYPVLGPKGTIGEVNECLIIRNANNRELDSYHFIRMIPSIEWSSYGDIYWYLIIERKESTKFRTRHPLNY